MKRRTRFRGDLQVDGDIVGSDGQPIGGGGSFDPTVPIPELHFAGDPTDPTSGMNIRWDEDLWGLVFEQPEGSGDTELYLVNSDDPSNLVELSTDGMQVSGYDRAANITLGGIGLSSYAINQSAMSIDSRFLHFNQGPDDFVAIGQSDWGALGLTTIVGEASADQPIFLTHRGDDWNDSSGRFNIDRDGAMRWGGGHGPSDVLLERADPDWWGGPGILHVDTTPEARLAGGSAGMVFGALDQSGPSAEIYEGGIGASNPAGPSFSMDAANTIASIAAFGSTTYAALRTHDDPTYPQASLSLNNSGKSALSIDAGTRPTMFFITDWSTDHANSMTMGARPGVDNFLEILGGSSGLVAHSPDGTAYKLTPPNGGGPAEWVAA